MTATRDLLTTLAILALAACLRHPALQWLVTAVAKRWLQATTASHLRATGGAGGLSFTAPSKLTATNF